MLRLQLKMALMAACRERDVYPPSPILGCAEGLQQSFDARERLGVRELAFLGCMEGAGVGFGVDVREVEEGEEAQDGFVGWSALELGLYVPCHRARVVGLKEDVVA